MLTKTRMAGLMLAAVVLFAPMAVYADNGAATDFFHKEGDWHHGKKDHMASMAKILNLSDAQVKQLKDIHQKQKEAMKSIFEQMKSNRETFNAEIVKAAPDMIKINDIQAQLKTIQSQIADNHLNSLLEIKKILTPEQFAGYMALEKEEKLMRHEGHNQFGHDQLGVSGMRAKDGEGHKHWNDKSDEGDRD